MNKLEIRFAVLAKWKEHKIFIKTNLNTSGSFKKKITKYMKLITNIDYFLIINIARFFKFLYGKATKSYFLSYQNLFLFLG